MSYYGQQQPPPAYGYAPPQQQSLPPGADPQLFAYFSSVDKDRSGQLSNVELKQALFNSDGTTHSEETCKLMINLFDRDNSGTISFQEFSALWKYLGDWRRIYERFDQDRSGTINREELRQALSAFGFNVSDKVLDLVVRKFAPRGYSAISFDAFVRACVTIKNLTTSFMAADVERRGYATLQYSQFLEMAFGVLP